MHAQFPPYRVGVEQVQGVLVTTGNEVAGYQISNYLGVVRGLTVRSASLGAAMLGQLKSLGGGNIQEWVEVCEGARHAAYTQMVQNAAAMGANAITGMRYDATEFMQGATEVLAYGTAVQVHRKEKPAA